MNIWYLPAGRPCLVCCFLTFWRRERRQRSAAAVTFHTRYWHCRKRHCDRLHSWRGEARTQERNQEGEKRREKERKKMFCVLFCFSPLDGDISLLLKTKLKFICVFLTGSVPPSVPLLRRTPPATSPPDEPVWGRSVWMWACPGTLANPGTGTVGPYGTRPVAAEQTHKPYFKHTPKPKQMHIYQTYTQNKPNTCISNTP